MHVDGDLTVHDASSAGGRDGAIRLQRLDLLYLGVRRDGIEVSAQGGAMIFLLGGEPFEEEIVMWWNFIGTDHDEIARFRQEWEDETARFGAVAGYTGEPARLPAPRLPGLRLRPRGRDGRRV